MFRLRRPDGPYLQELQERRRALPLSYADADCSRGTAPEGYVVDSYRVQLGSGAAVFERARQAVRDWRMLRLGWVEPCWPDTSVKEGTLVGTLAQVFGLWTVNVCRIVYIVEEDGPVVRYGFAYGTLPGHVECGEERFLVEWHRADDSVWYDIRAVSKPGVLLTRLAYPLTRRLQRRFGRDSLRAMVEAVALPSTLQS
jgi:uncharacterized protein (UPF0548 family)